MKLLFCIILCVLVVGCTDPEAAKRILTANGFTEIEITGYNFFACSRDDWYQTGFIARSVTGNKVSGTVCSGMIVKNHTIRFE